MSFKKLSLFSKNFIVLDIWSYKIRSAYGKLTSSSLEILGFWEKRQEQESFFLWEMRDFNSIGDNILQVIEKSKKWDVQDYIVNLPSNQFFLFSHQLNYVRKSEREVITEQELYDIIKHIEKTAIELSLAEIQEKSGYVKADVKRIFSSISSISIDGKKIVDPLEKSWKNIKISIVNIFAPLSDFEVITKIFRSLGIERPQFIPFEYSVLKLFPESQDVVVVNVGNTKTYISIQEKEHILWTSRISIGMNDLIKKIKEKYAFTQIEIIKNLDNYFEEEKNEFLEIFSDCLATGISEIVWDEICPEKFFIIGGGGNNTFIQNFFKQLQLSKYGIKIVKDIEILPYPSIDIKNGDFLLNSSHIDMLSMVLSYQYFESKKDSFLTRFLEKAVIEIENE